MPDPWPQLNIDITTCRACPRLVAWREQVAREKRRAYRDFEYWGRPVPGFGDVKARLWLVGLAPGAHGSNRTGQMFTGDTSGDTLFAVLHRAGFASQPSARSRNDGLTLYDAFITAVGRCAPPQNKPTGAELLNCRPFLVREWNLMPQVQVLMALGHIAFTGCLSLLRDDGFEVPTLKFGHGVHYPLLAPASGRTLHLLGCYHPSRQNTQTGRLTPPMMDDVFSLARSLIGDYI
jgi:uracil-DNA glycosylase family 4